MAFSWCFKNYNNAKLPAHNPSKLIAAIEGMQIAHAAGREDAKNVQPIGRNVHAALLGGDAGEEDAAEVWI